MGVGGAVGSSKIPSRNSGLSSNSVHSHDVRSPSSLPSFARMTPVASSIQCVHRAPGPRQVTPVTGRPRHSSVPASEG
jgi:hypothetical protein